jgi:putative tricarboxylic transport membrane protein
MVSSPMEAVSEAPAPLNARTGSRRWTRTIAPLVLLALGLSAAVGAWQLKLGTLQHPGPGFWPLIISAAITLSAAALLVWPGEEPKEAWGRRSLSVAAGIAILCAFVVLFELVGFFLPAVLMLILWLRVFGRESWRWTIMLAVAGPAVLYVIFDRLLGVPFPGDLVLGVFS